MFDWIKGNIINSADVICGYDATGTAVAEEKTLNTKLGRLLVKRGGEYFAKYMSKVAKTEGYKGTPAELVIECDGLTLPDPTVENQLLATLKIQMFNKFLGEYANANWALFGKPVLADFVVPANATAANIADALYEALSTAVPENNRFVAIAHTAGETTVTLTLTDCYADFASFALEVYDPTACDSCLGFYRPLDVDENVTITHNVEPFATGEWIEENLRFPSYPNVRYAGLYADERPVPGAVYTQYAFRYSVPELGHGGLSFVGQNITSDTLHTFYVLKDGVVDVAFENALKDAGVKAADIVADVAANVKGSTAAADKEAHLEVHIENVVD